jgi:arylsulfatase A-like enzyme
MVNLPGADVYGHLYGGPATPAVMSQVVAGLDRDIDRIVQAYKKAGIFGQTMFVVTADHGMVPNDHAVPGDTTKATVRQAGGQYQFHTGGTAADIYLRNPTMAQSVANGMARVPGVEAAYFLTETEGAYAYVLAPRAQIEGALDDAYHYLLATFAGPTAPDVVAAFRENTIGAAFKNAHGDHGGLNWGAQHIPLILSGPGLRTGAVSHFPARLMDVAPTILRLLGVPFSATDGIVLADALVRPTGGEVSDQTALAPALSTYQDAIIGRSRIDIAEDQKAGLKPPPSLPARP